MAGPRGFEPRTYSSTRLWRRGLGRPILPLYPG